tara:strand:+ start:2202 stop:3680 length:1479 start_codon:yes stop_codon:yes gene_type:complete
MMIHISRDGQEFGPYTPEQVQEYLAAGNLVATDMAWHEGAADWYPITQVGGGAPAFEPNLACPKCAAGLESDQVVCLACGHNLDDPVPSPEEQATAAQPQVVEIKIPPSQSYEAETAQRSAFVNSVGWAFLVACVLPIFGTAGNWHIPVYDMWLTPAASDAPNVATMKPYTWEMMFDTLAAGIVGIACCIMASSMHGRDRGGVLLALGLIIIGTSLAFPDVGKFEVQYVDDNSTAVLDEPPPGHDQYNPHIPTIHSKAEIGNQFYDKLDFNPGNYSIFIMVFGLAWVGIVAGAKVRFYRPDNIASYVMSLVGGVAVILMWLLPLGDGMLVMTAIDSISNDIVLGVGLVLMMLMQIGAAVLCFMNQRKIRPSLMKKYSNLAVTLMVTSMLVPIVPVWGKVIYESSNKYTETAGKRYTYVTDQLQVAATSYEVKHQEKYLSKLKAPLNARIESVMGWFLIGVKYMAWLGGVCILIPMACIDLLCGKREPDGKNF